MEQMNKTQQNYYSPTPCSFLNFFHASYYMDGSFSIKINGHWTHSCDS